MRWIQAMSRVLGAPVRLGRILAGHRFLLGQLMARAFAARHASSYLGWLWTPLSTGALFGVYVVVFSTILQIRVERLGTDLASGPTVSFGVFLMAALVPFMALNDAVLRAAGVFRAHVNLVQRVRFPAQVLVVGNIGGALLHHAVSLLVVIGVCAVLGQMVVGQLPWALAALVLWGLWILGLSLVLSVVGAFLPDISEVLALGLQVAFYAAPIVYPLTFVHSESLRSVIQSNPLTPLAGLARAGLVGMQPPSWTAVVVLLIGGMALVAIGAAALERWSDSIPDLL